MRILNMIDDDFQDIKLLLRQMSEAEDRWEAFKGRKLLELVRHLQTQGPDLRACVLFNHDELMLFPCDTPDRVTLLLWVDWPDYAPPGDCLPDAYFRFQIKSAGAVLSQDVRARSVEEAQRIIWEAFGWGNPN